MTVDNALHPKINVDRLYIPTKEGGRGLQGVKEMVKVTNLGLENYVKESRERLLTASRPADIDLIEQSQKLQLRLRNKRRRRVQFLGRKKCYMTSLCSKLRK